MATKARDWQAARLVDMSGGLNTMVPPNLLNNNESPVSENVDRSLKGIIRPSPGRRRRFPAAFDANGIAGMGTYYKTDGTSRLIAGVGNKLYADKPHLVTIWDSQTDWQRGTVSGAASLTQNPGAVTLPVITYTNLLSANQSDVETGLADFGTAGSSVTLSRDTSVSWHGAASAKATAGVSTTMGIYVETPVTAGRTYTFSVYLKSSVAGKDLQLIVQWFNQSGGPLKTTSSSTSPSNVAFTRLSFTDTAPTGAAKARLYAQIVATAGVSLWWDGAQFEEGSTAHDWILGGTSAAIPASGTWTSEVLDVSQAQDLSSGRLTFTEDVPADTTVTWATRSSADGVTWSDWFPLNQDGSLASPPNPKVQVQASLSTTVAQAPTINSATLSFDATPSMTLLASDFTSGGTYRMATLNGILAIGNGLDSPRKYDGTTLSALGGSPPKFAFVKVHKNRLWVATGSRLSFSDLLNPESWPVLNFIDISPDDGDIITGLLPYVDMLIVTKQHSVWAVQGDSIDNFNVVRIHADIGNIAPDSLTVANNLVTFVSDSGVWFTDLNTPVLATQRLQPTWDALNHRKLDLCASGYDAAHNMLYVAVPSGASSVPDQVWAFDVLRNAWDIRTTWKASSFVSFREGGADNFWFGDSTQGQVWAIDSPTDDGQLIPFVWESKSFDFGAPEWVKYLRRVYLNVKADGRDGVLSVSFRADSGAESAPLTANVPNDGSVKTLVFFPSQVGVFMAHQFSIIIRETVPGARTQVHSIAFEYRLQAARAS